MAKLYIPDLFVASYKKQHNTMNGLIAYLTYYKTKNKSTVYKKDSWLKWQDKSIPVNEFENKPTKGFYISRDIKRVSYSHFGTSRYEKMRIYDPRGFDFEISIKNLALILFCSDLNKCEISGEFVYAWDGQELVLLPTVSEEYQEAIATTIIQNNKVSAKDLIIGATYLNKDGRDYTYLGRHQYYSKPNSEKELNRLYSNDNYPFIDQTKTMSENYSIISSSFVRNTLTKKDHLFINNDYFKKFNKNQNKDNFFYYIKIGGVGSFSHLVEQEKHPLFPDVYQEVLDSELLNNILAFKMEKKDVSLDDISVYPKYYYGLSNKSLSDNKYFLKLFEDTYCNLNFVIKKNNGEEEVFSNTKICMKDEYNNFMEISYSDLYLFLEGELRKHKIPLIYNNNYRKALSPNLIFNFWKTYFSDNNDLIKALIAKDKTCFDEKYHVVLDNLTKDIVMICYFSVPFVQTFASLNKEQLNTFFNSFKGNTFEIVKLFDEK